MKNISQKLVAMLVLIIVSISFIFPNFAYAYTKEFDSTGVTYDIVITEDGEKEILQDIKVKMLDKMKEVLNEEIEDALNELKIDDLSKISSYQKNQITEKLKKVMVDEIYDGYLIDAYYYYGNLEVLYNGYIVRDYALSKNFRRVMDNFKAEIEDGSYVEKYIKSKLPETAEEDGSDNDESIDDEEEYISNEDNYYDNNEFPNDSGDGSSNSGQPDEYYETDGMGGGILDTVLGFLTYVFKLGILAPGLAVNIILTQIGSVGQNIDSISDIPIISFEDILFNRVPLLDVNVLSPTKTASGMKLGSLLVEIRTNIAGWYVAFRNLAIVISLATLVYIGIKVGLNSTGEGRARFKEMLRHWVVGFALIFILHFIISFVLHANTALVNMFARSQEHVGNYTAILLSKAFEINLIQSWGAAIMYTILMIVTLIFCIIYIKRMLITSFLVIIAPLVTISYSIDKIGNNRSEILNQWLKEFCYNVLIQPFHCIVYMVFVGTAIAKLEQAANRFSFGDMIYSVIALLCIFVGEKIVRQIFGFTKSKSVASKLFSGAMITQAIKDVKQIREVRNGADDEEETEAPATMPDGTSTVATTQAYEKQISKDNLRGAGEEIKGAGLDSSKKTKTGENTSSGGGTKDSGAATKSGGQRGRLKSAVQKIQDHTPTTVKDIGSGYIKGAKRVTGISMVQEHIESKKNKPAKTKRGEMSQFRKQFLVASDVYARQNGLSKRQLEWKIRELRQTSFDKLENNSDRVYKMWIDKMDKDFLKNGSRDAKKTMQDFMENKYTGA